MCKTLLILLVFSASIIAAKKNRTGCISTKHLITPMTGTSEDYEVYFLYDEKYKNAYAEIVVEQCLNLQDTCSGGPKNAVCKDDFAYKEILSGAIGIPIKKRRFLFPNGCKCEASDISYY